MNKIEKYIDFLTSFLKELLISANQLNHDWWFIVASISGLALYTALFFQNRFIRLFFASLSLIILIYEFAIYTNGLRIARELHIYVPRFREYFVTEFGVVFLLSILISFLIFQRTSIIFGSLKERLSKRSTIEKLAGTDIRNIEKHLPKTIKPFNPVKYFKRNKIFFGLNAQKKPVYISQEKWRASHLQITGTTGFGKGVQAMSLCSQSLRSGETVIIFDPKDDEFAPHVMANECKKLNKQFYYLDLKGELPQINLFQNKTLFDIEELLVAGFGLSDSGTDADFYKLNDRKAARKFSHFIDDNNRSIKDAVFDFMQEHEEATKDAPKFLDSLCELATLPVLHAKKGINFPDILEENSVIYIKGSMRNQKILALQKILVISLMQFCERRDREDANSVLFLYDEFSSLASRPCVEALSAIRDRKAHVMIAHQSNGDLNNCQKDIDPEVIIGSVNSNCTLKFVYSTNDIPTLEQYEKLSGIIQYDQSTVTLNRNNALAETSDFQRTIRSNERYHIDTNIFQSIPKGCGVIFGNGLAEIAFTSPIIVKKDYSLIQPTVFDNSQRSDGNKGFDDGMEGLIDVD